MTLARPVTDAKREPHPAVHENVDIDGSVAEAVDGFAFFVVVRMAQRCRAGAGARFAGAA